MSNMVQGTGSYVRTYVRTYLCFWGIHFAKEPGVNLLADDLCPDVVLLGKTEPHLLKDEPYLLLSLHRAKGLHLHTCGTKRNI